MIGTKAIHHLGDISRSEGDLCYIHGEDQDNYIGNWVRGFGFIDVKFPKATTRELTDEEIKYWNKRAIWISDGPSIPLKVD